MRTARDTPLGRRNGTYAAFTAASPLARDCPKCGAARGHSCVSLRNYGVGRVPLVMKKPHVERQRRIGTQGVAADG